MYKGLKICGKFYCKQKAHSSCGTNVKQQTTKANKKQSSNVVRIRASHDEKFSKTKFEMFLLQVTDHRSQVIVLPILKQPKPFSVFGYSGEKFSLTSELCLDIKRYTSTSPLPDCENRKMWQL